MDKEELLERYEAYGDEGVHAADPQYDKPHWQLIHAMATLGQAHEAVGR